MCHYKTFQEKKYNEKTPFDKESLLKKFQMSGGNSEENIVAETVQKVEETVQNVTEKATDFVQNAAEETLNKAQETVETVKESVTETVSDLTADTTQMVENKTEDLTEVIENVGFTKGDTQVIPETIVTPVKETVEKVADIVTNTIPESVKETVEEKVEEVSSFIFGDSAETTEAKTETTQPVEQVVAEAKTPEVTNPWASSAQPTQPIQSTQPVPPTPPVQPVSNNPWASQTPMQDKLSNSSENETYNTHYNQQTQGRPGYVYEMPNKAGGAAPQGYAYTAPNTMGVPQTTGSKINILFGVTLGFAVFMLLTYFLPMFLVSGTNISIIGILLSGVGVAGKIIFAILTLLAVVALYVFAIVKKNTILGLVGSVLGLIAYFATSIVYNASKEAILEISYFLVTPGFGLMFALAMGMLLIMSLVTLVASIIKLVKSRKNN